MFGLKMVRRGVLLGVFTLFIGCGSDISTVSSDSKLSRQASVYISKGNYVQVAQYAYAKVMDESNEENFDVKLPGVLYGEKATPSLYTLETIYHDSDVAKIIVQNHKHRLEIKFVGENVHLLLRGSNYMEERQLSFSDFVLGR